MAASDYVPIFFKNRLHLAGRPQMGRCLSNDNLMISGDNPSLFASITCHFASRSILLNDS
jgi:hypothetical protein